MRILNAAKALDLHLHIQDEVDVRALPRIYRRAQHPHAAQSLRGCSHRARHLLREQILAPGEHRVQRRADVIRLD